MNYNSKRRRHGTGFTLVELLVALGIASLITLIALPIARDTVRQHSATRSSEMVRQIIVNARAQAIRSNRPFGIAFNRVGATGAQADLCQSISYVATPPNYSGELLTSRAIKLPRDFPAYNGLDSSTRVRFAFPQADAGRLWFEARTYEDAIATNNTAAIRKLSFRPGATVVFEGNVGPFTISSLRTLQVTTDPHRPPYNATMLVMDYDLGGNAGSLPRFIDGLSSSPYDFLGYKFALEGLPQETFMPGAELPGDSVIDLSISGIGLGGAQFNSEAIRLATSLDSDAPASESGFDRVIVMYGPRGSVQRVYTESYSGTSYDILPASPAGTIYIAVGRADGVLRPEEYGSFDTVEAWPGKLPNFADTETVWISLRGSSGAVLASPQVSPIDGAAQFYAAHAITVPTPTGTTLADRAVQINHLGLRLSRGRQLAMQGALMQ